MLGYHRRFCPRWSTLNIFWVFLLQTSSNFSKLGYNLSIGDIESVVGSGSKLGSSMAVSNETNVLFIPYRPSYSSKPFSANDPGISQQKHAAREYHRKVKLKRLANKTTTTHKRKPYTEIDINSDQSRWSIRSISPRDNTFPNGEERMLPTESPTLVRVSGIYFMSASPKASRTMFWRCWTMVSRENLH